MKSIVENIIISRTDNIGDVVLTLPVAGILKKYFPEMRIAFMGKAYTKPVVEACKNVDEFIDVDTFFNKEVLSDRKKPEAILHVLPVASIARRAKQINIPVRIGTTNRLYHLFTCNELVRFSRKRSDLHEAQLNLKLLEALGVEKEFSKEEIFQAYGLEKLQTLLPQNAWLVDDKKYNLILHPKTQGSAREWGLKNFVKLIFSLDKRRYKIFVSGTSKERKALQPLFEQVGEDVTDVTGKMDLHQFISFIAACDGLVSNSTGPLHIAAATGKDAIGIYPAIRPMHPGRWAPIGPKAQVFVLNKFCEDCKANHSACHCIQEVSPALIKHALDKAVKNKFALSHT